MEWRNDPSAALADVCSPLVTTVPAPDRKPPIGFDDHHRAKQHDRPICSTSLKYMERARDRKFADRLVWEFFCQVVFWFVPVPCLEVCPGKASMFSRRQSCRGRSQSPVVRIAEEMETEPSKPIDKISRGEITSHRAVSKENALWPRKR